MVHSVLDCKIDSYYQQNKKNLIHAVFSGLIPINETYIYTNISLPEKRGK